MGILKLLVFALIAVIIEVPLALRAKDAPIEKDPMAVPYKAKRVDEPGFGYIPGRSVYDEKAGRSVTDWKYEWEYMGKKHHIMFCDDPGSQYEHYMATFPDEIDITIHKRTGRYYKSREMRRRSRNALLTFIIPVAIAWCLTSVLFG